MTVTRMIFAAACALMAGIAVENARTADACNGSGCAGHNLAIAAAIR
jgi:hypothetical protein